MPASDYESPSALARSNRFPAWARGAGLVETTALSEFTTAAKSYFDENLKQSSLPRLIVDRHEVPRQPSGFFSYLRAWGMDNPSLLQDDDNYRIADLLPALKLAQHRIKHAVENRAKEVSQRHGIDTLLHLAFAYLEVETYHVEMECDLRLPKSTRTDIHVGSNAIVDTLVTLEMSQRQIARLVDSLARSVDDLDEGHWSKVTDNATLSVIVFAGEFKPQVLRNNKNQLVMDLGTAQWQRRALSLPDTYIWGATCSSGVFDLYFSKWMRPPSNDANDEHSQTVAFASIHKWNLCNAVEFLQCYATMCNIARDQESITQLLEALDPAAVRAALRKNRWRALYPPDSTTGAKRPRFDGDGWNRNDPADGGVQPGEQLEDAMDVESGDDLDSDEESEWQKSTSSWNAEARKAAGETRWTGPPLFEYRLKAHDGDGGLTPNFGEWLSDIPA